MPPHILKDLPSWHSVTTLIVVVETTGLLIEHEPEREGGGREEEGEREREQFEILPNMDTITVVDTKMQVMAQCRRSPVTIVAIKGKEGGQNGVPSMQTNLPKLCGDKFSIRKWRDGPPAVGRRLPTTPALYRMYMDACKL